jgi:hypothetical protein
MKLHELFERKLLLEDAVTLPKVRTLESLIDPKTGEYYTGVVNVTYWVEMLNKKLSKLPVKFGTVGLYFSCIGSKLTSLDGAPSSVGNNFDCSENELTSLEGIHKIIKKMYGGFYCYGNPIVSGGIGLLLIEGLTGIYADQPALKIINKYLGQGKKGLLLCQDELIEAGYEEFAKL